MGMYADDLDSMAAVNPDALPDLLAALSDATDVWGPKVPDFRVFYSQGSCITIMHIGSLCLLSLTIAHCAGCYQDALTHSYAFCRYCSLLDCGWRRWQ